VSQTIVMKFNFYNKKQSKIDYARELLSYQPNILIADSIMYDSMSANDMINLPLLDKYDDVAIFKLATAYYHNDAKKCADLEKCHYDLKYLSKLKHKNKDILVLEGKFKLLAKATRKILKTANEEHLASQNLLEMMTFAEEGILILNALNYFENDGKENFYIKQFITNIKDREAFFCLDQNVEEMHSFITLESNDYESCDFIKIPLLKFPILADLSYDKLKHTRDNLAAILLPFKNQCKELNEKLAEISFAKENLKEIAQWCNESIANNIIPVQKAIDDSLYISQQRNKTSGQNEMQLCMGVASTMFPVNYYEKNGIFAPYITSEIQKQLDRQMDVNSSGLFVYYKLRNE
jgi:hypothetical protein